MAGFAFRLSQVELIRSTSTSGAQASAEGLPDMVSSGNMIEEIMVNDDIFINRIPWYVYILILHNITIITTTIFTITTMIYYHCHHHYYSHELVELQ